MCDDIAIDKLCGGNTSLTEPMVYGTVYYTIFPTFFPEQKKAVLKPIPIARVLADHRAIANFETFAQLGIRLLLRAPSHP